MSFLNDVKQKVGEFASENSTTLLTAGGVVGTVATAVLAGRAGFKAADIIREKELEHIHLHKVDGVIDEDNSTMGLSNTQKVMLVWPHFVPPVVTGTATVTAIIFSHRMSAQKAAALAAAYGLAERNLSEYKEKVAEKITGPKKHQIEDELAQDRANRTEGHDKVVIVDSDSDVLCFDEPTGRYFKSSMQNIRSAINATVAEINRTDWATASFFYSELDLPDTTWTREVGWNRDQLPDLKISSIVVNGRPALAIDFTVLPKLDYVPKHY